MWLRQLLKCELSLSGTPQCSKSLKLCVFPEQSEPVPSTSASFQRFSFFFLGHVRLLVFWWYYTVGEIRCAQYGTPSVLPWFSLGLEPVICNCNIPVFISLKKNNSECWNSHKLKCIPSCSPRCELLVYSCFNIKSHFPKAAQSLSLSLSLSVLENIHFSCSLFVCVCLFPWLSSCWLCKDSITIKYEHVNHHTLPYFLPYLSSLDMEAEWIWVWGSTAWPSQGDW